MDGASRCYCYCGMDGSSYQRRMLAGGERPMRQGPSVTPLKLRTVQDPLQIWHALIFRLQLRQLALFKVRACRLGLTPNAHLPNLVLASALYWSVQISAPARERENRFPVHWIPQGSSSRKHNVAFTLESAESTNLQWSGLDNRRH